MSLASHPWWMWLGFLIVVAILLALDLGIFNRGQKEIQFKQASRLIMFYVFIAFLFGVGVYYYMGHEVGMQFAMGYLIELTLSVDNIFVIALVLTHFAVPKHLHHRVLFWGVVVAVVLRFVFIAAGTALITRFEWTLYIFGAFLIYTGIKMMLSSSSEEPDMNDNFIIKFCRKNLRTTEDYKDAQFFHRENGLLYFTPLFVVLMVVNLVDIVFALDSIPAIFAITLDPFIVFTSNIFAILGLRSMYFVLATVIERFKYLKYGLSVILVIIGLKMVINHYFHRDVISTEASLIITAVIIIGSILYSLYRTKNDQQIISPEEK